MRLRALERSEGGLEPCSAEDLPSLSSSSSDQSSSKSSSRWVGRAKILTVDKKMTYGVEGRLL